MVILIMMVRNINNILKNNIGKLIYLTQFGKLNLKKFKKTMLKNSKKYNKNSKEITIRICLIFNNI